MGRPTLFVVAIRSRCWISGRLDSLRNESTSALVTCRGLGVALGLDCPRPTKLVAGYQVDAAEREASADRYRVSRIRERREIVGFEQGHYRTPVVSSSASSASVGAGNSDIPKRR